MCGIAGIVDLAGGPPPDREALARMAAALHHRGPDSSGIYRDRRAGLAHARLSIIDHATGQQPMASDDQSVWLVFNGEIFNYVELRAELMARGRRFRTSSDTEVLLVAWQEWGEEALPRLNGQWAFAVWEPARGRLSLCRDRLGVRPLYHAEHRGRLLFASTVRALFAGAPDFPRALDPLGLDDTFTFWTVLAPRSVFRGVAELEPGHLRVIDAAGVRDTAYYTPRFPAGGLAPLSGSVDDAAAAVRTALARATELRMLRADVPVATYLSGGLDSSLVSALALAATGGSAFHTFSLRFEDHEYDEGAYQRRMAARLGSVHHEVTATRGEIARVFPDVIAHAERPLLRSAPAPLFLLSRAVRDAGLKVVLTGEGADELFAGYDLFREGLVRRFWARQPGSRLRPLLLTRLYPWLERSPARVHAMARAFFGRDLARWREPGFAHLPRWQTTAALKRLWTPELAAALAGRDAAAELCADLPAELATWSPLAQDQYLELRTLLAGYLLSSQGDRMLMAHSVEGRFPFLDRDVVELACALPDNHKLRVLDEKHVLKRAAAGLVPPDICRRPKQPYRAPDGLAFLAPGAPDWVEEVVAPRALREAGVFRPEAVELLLRACRQRAARGQLANGDHMALVGVLSLQLLHQIFVRCDPAAATRAARPLPTTVIDRVTE
jgi:asparagine synthase (glutamine-hydrolysing)